MRGRGRSPKGCTELSGAIIYDDLPSAPSIVPARTRPRFKPVPLDGEEVVGMTMGVHLYTPEPRSAAPSEHLYQSISSGEAPVTSLVVTLEDSVYYHCCHILDIFF